MSADPKNNLEDTENDAAQAPEETGQDIDTTDEMAEEEEALLSAQEDISDQLKQAQQKAEENWDLLLRTRAEMDNLRRRTQKDLENAHKFALEKFVTELLPIIDGMEMGLGVEEATADSMREGMELTINMMRSTFDKFNVTVIDPMNEKFDPDLHQAMSMQPSDEVEPNTVIAVMQKGYTLNDRLVRPAMVMVSKATGS